MIAYIAALLLLCVTLAMVALQKTYYFFPARELKRQARGGDRDAAVLYRAVAYGASLRLLLWLIIGLTLAGSFALLTVVAPVWLVFIAVAGLVWYAFGWSPNARAGSLSRRITLLLTPVVAKILYYAHPTFDAVSRWLEQRRAVTFHTGLFEHDDLVELIKTQSLLTDNRIAHDELNLVLHALTFGDKTVGSVMVPKREVISVKDSDVIGPILMDELYDSKHSRFPVLSANGHEVLGTLYLRQLISATHGGLVRDVMQPAVNYVHEDQSLYQVLHAFLTTKQHIFFVVNSDQEYVGAVTIEDVLEQVIGHRIEDDFDSYDDVRAVAAAGDSSVTKST